MSASTTSSTGRGRGLPPLGLRFVLLVVASLATMILDHREGHLTRARQALSALVYPVQLIVDLPFNAYRNTRESLTERARLLAENEQLRRQMLDANFQLQQLDALRVENSRLRELLDSTSRIEDRVLIAEILAVDLDPYRQRFSLNRGSSDGVFVGQAILDSYGILGQVVQAGPWSAEALLITDADHAVPVVVNRNGLRTIAVGTGDERRLRLPYLTNSADIEEGDLLVSSGLGEIFPPGYPVGRVVSVETRPSQPFAEVYAQPMSELDRDQEVLLVFSGDEGAADAVGTGASLPASEPGKPQLAEAD
jgi:rod shape-determining protein MreC